MARIKDLDQLINYILNFAGTKRKSRDTSTLGSSSISTTYIEHIIEQLKGEQHQNSTKKNYDSVWKSFNQFFIKLDRKPSN